MSKYTIYGKNGIAKYTGCPVFHGAYLKVGYLEFREISSPTPIEWEVGDYVEYDRTGLRYTLYTIPQQSVTKQVRKESYGAAFVYRSVQFHEPMRLVELAPFRDLVPDLDLNIHFSTQSAIAVYDDVYGVAERIQVCLNAYAQDYASKSGSVNADWLVEVVDASSDAELNETLHLEQDYSVSGVSCLGALEKIYELWNNIGWTYSFRDGHHVITIGGADVRTYGNTIPDLTYGRGNGLCNLQSDISNRTEMATRIFVYGSSKNMVSRWYNNLPYDIRDRESIDIQHLMLPVAPVESLGWGGWGKTGTQYDAAKAYLENPEAIARYGLIEKTVYLDGSEGDEICPSIKGATIGAVRTALGSPTVRYYPKTSVYNDPLMRVDKIASCENPTDSGTLSQEGSKYSFQSSVPVSAISEIIGSGTDFTFTYLSTNVLSGKYGDVEMVLGMVGTIKSEGSLVSGSSLMMILYDGSGAMSSTDVALSYMGVIGGKHTYRFTIPDLKFEANLGVNGSVSVFLTASNMKTEGAMDVEVEVSAGNAEIGVLASRTQVFTMKIPQVGFNINDRISFGNGKCTVGMTGGMCAGRNFLVKACTYNPLTDDWTLVCYRQKDSSIGAWFPNSDYPIQSGDSYVLFDIALPDIYVTMAENRLLEEGRRLLERMSKPTPIFTPAIDPIVAKSIQDGLGVALTPIREGRYFHVLDEDVEAFGMDYILVDTVTISEGEANLPIYKITLREGKKITIKETDSTSTSDKTTSVMEGVASGIGNSGGGGGVSSYSDLTDLPSVNGREIVGDLTLADLGIISGEEVRNMISAISQSKITIAGISVGLGGSITKSALASVFTGSDAVHEAKLASQATKLQNARELWGNAFDGTSDVAGNITLRNAGVKIVEALTGTPNSGYANGMSAYGSRNNADAVAGVGFWWTKNGSNTSADATITNIYLGVSENPWYDHSLRISATEVKVDLPLVSTSTIQAAQFKVTGGKGTQFLKADGTIDSVAYLPLTGGTLSNSLIVNGSVAVANTLRVGGATLSWDNVNQCLAVDKSFYSLGQVSALGAGEPTGSGGSGDSNKVYLTQAEYDALVDSDQIIPYVEYNIYEEV